MAACVPQVLGRQLQGPRAAPSPAPAVSAGSTARGGPARTSAWQTARRSSGAAPRTAHTRLGSFCSTTRCTPRCARRRCRIALRAGDTPRKQYWRGASASRSVESTTVRKYACSQPGSGLQGGTGKRPNASTTRPTPSRCRTPPLPPSGAKVGRQPMPGRADPARWRDPPRRHQGTVGSPPELELRRPTPPGGGGGGGGGGSGTSTPKTRRYARSAASTAAFLRANQRATGPVR